MMRKILYAVSFIFLAFSYVIYKFLNEEAFLNPSCVLFGVHCYNLKEFALNEGSRYDKIFQQIIDLYKQNFVDGLDVGSSLCIYWRNIPLLDVSAGIGYKQIPNDKMIDNANISYSSPYLKTTLQSVYETSKVFCALSIAILVDRGYLSYEDKISKYWADFSVGNKDNVTIADLVQNKAGLAFLDTKISHENLRYLDELAEILAEQPHNYNGTLRQVYHTATYGHYINEIVRRVDPKKRHLDRFIKEEIVKPMNIDFYFMLTKDQFFNLTSQVLHILYTPKYLSFMVKYKFIDPIFKIIENVKNIATGIFSFMFNIKNDVLATECIVDEKSGNWSLWWKSSKIYEKDYIWHGVNDFDTHRVLLPSFGGKSNAASLAKVAALLANNCELNEFRLLNRTTCNMIMKKGDSYPCDILGANFTYTYGGFTIYSQNLASYFRGNTHIIGYRGLGGSYMIWNQEKNFALSYVTNAMHYSNDEDKRASSIISSLYELIYNLS